MRKAMINLVYGLVVMILITYSFVLFDDAFRKTGIFNKLGTSKPAGPFPREDKDK